MLSPYHGYACGVAIASSLFLMTMGVQVGGYRKRANVPYPYMSCSKEEAEKDQNKHLFNCAQRVHYNTIEIFPIYMTLFAVSAINYPLIASVSGVIWLLGRWGYSRGYLTGDPAKRNQGAYSYIGLLTLLGCSLKTVYDLASQ